MIRYVMAFVLVICALGAYAAYADTWPFGAQPSDYPFAQSVSIENAGSTKTGILPVIVNADEQVAANRINRNGTRVLCTQGVLTTIDCMSTDMFSSTARWWLDVGTLPGATIRNYLLYTGPNGSPPSSPAPETFPGLYLSTVNNSVISLPHNTAYNVANNLVVTTAFATETCGQAVDKSLPIYSSGFIAGMDGWGINILGNNVNATNVTGNNLNTTTLQFLTLNPSVDLWLCGVPAPSTHLASIEYPHTLRLRIIHDLATDVKIADFNPSGNLATSLDLFRYRTDTPSGVAWFMLPRPVFLEAGEQYQILYSLAVSGVRTAGSSTTATLTGIGTMSSLGGSTATFDGQTFRGLAIFANTKHRFGIWYVPADGISASNPVTIEAHIEGTVARSTLYDGEHHIYFLQYTNPNLTLYQDSFDFDGIIATTSVGSGNIDPTTQNLYLGRGFQGHYLAAQMRQIGGSEQLFLEGIGSRLFLAQEGTGGNGFTWIYTWDDDSVVANDASLTFVSDTTGINVTGGATQTNPLLSFIVAETESPDWMERYFATVGASDRNSRLLVAGIVAVVVIFGMGLLGVSIRFAMVILGVLALGMSLVGILPIYLIIVLPLLGGIAIFLNMLIGARGGDA